MARKIFVSYKHSDNNVFSLGHETTARTYVDLLVEIFKDDEIYKGEGDEDLSEFKDETIQAHLRDKIYDSSITLVLISPNMKENYKDESDQWIPWEISYSLKEITRDDRTSKTNALLAVVLPDENNDYSYFIVDDACQKCRCRILYTGRLFQILRDNMFNIKDPIFSNCPNHQPKSIYTGESCYIKSVKWSDFINDMEECLTNIENIRNKIDDYNITKTVSD